MAMLSRERMLDSLLDLSGRPHTRTRSELLATALRCALQLTEADGATIVTGHTRRLHRVSIRRDALEPESRELASGDSDLMHMLHRNGHPVPVEDLSLDVRAQAPDGCPEAVHGGESVLGAADQAACGKVAQIVRAEIGEQSQPDVGGRGP